MEKKMWWLVIAAGLVVLLLVLWKFMHAPSVGSIKYEDPKKSPTPTAMELIRYDGKKISFAYENKYVLASIENQDKNILENWELTGKAGVFNHFVITLRQAKSNVIEDVPGVLLREIKPNDYKKAEVKWKEVGGVEFVRADMTEWSDFFIAEGKSLIVSMTVANSEKDRAILELRKLVDSIKLVEQ